MARGTANLTRAIALGWDQKGTERGIRVGKRGRALSDLLEKWLRKSTKTVLL